MQRGAWLFAARGRAKKQATVAEQRRRRVAVRERFRWVGAHGVIDSLAELLGMVEELTTRLHRGERP